ncbi:WXG100 family type VII secretion target [Dietzia sp.]|uniref:WXG100 family type VII secretion target n=1 Tax=Dietzia sp. TaxID=1871616 RepID=UPI002FD8C5E1
MGALFQIAGGTLSAQDETAAAALKAAAEPAPVINGPSALIAGMSSIAAYADPAIADTGFDWVDGEDASGMSLETIKTGAESLSPDSLRSTATRLTTASQTLGDASATLLSSVQQHLGSSWTGEFADTALANVSQFHTSATSLASDLDTVANRANALADGYDSTRTQVAQLAAGDEPTDKAEKEAARENAQRIIHSDYNPHIEQANLSGLSFTPAHRVGSASGGTTGVNPVDLWNGDVPSAHGGGAGASSGTGVDAPTIATSSSSTSNGAAPSPNGGTGASGGGAASAGTSPTTSGVTTGAGALPTPIPPMTANSAPTHATTTSSGAPNFSASTSTPGARGSGAFAGTTPQQRGSAAAGRVPAGGAASASGRSPAGSSAFARPSAGGNSPFGSGSSGIGRAPAGYASAGASSPFGTGSARGGSAGGSGVPGSPAAARMGLGAPGGLAGAAGSGAPGGSGSGGTASSGRAGAPMMGMAPGASAGRGGDGRHSPADYLAHPANSSELVGSLPGAVHPVLRGGRAPETNSDVQLGSEPGKEGAT